MLAASAARAADPGRTASASGSGNGSRDVGGESFCCHYFPHVRVVLCDCWNLVWAGAFFSGALVEFILEKTHLHLRKKQGCTSKGSQETCYSSDLQDLTQAEACECVDSVGQYVDFMGKDGHDTDGSLSLGKGEGFRIRGRPRRCHGVAELRDGMQVSAVCRPRDPKVLRRENDFCERGGGKHHGAQGEGVHGMGAY